MYCFRPHTRENTDEGIILMTPALMLELTADRPGDSCLTLDMDYLAELEYVQKPNFL